MPPGTSQAIPLDMTDSDTLALSTDPTVTTCLAAYLNAAMARNANAREAYARIYGADWSTLGNGAEINDTASSSSATAL